MRFSQENIDKMNKLIPKKVIPKARKNEINVAIVDQLRDIVCDEKLKTLIDGIGNKELQATLRKTDVDLKKVGNIEERVRLRNNFTNLINEIDTLNLKDKGLSMALVELNNEINNSWKVNPKDQENPDDYIKKCGANIVALMDARLNLLDRYPGIKTAPIIHNNPKDPDQQNGKKAGGKI